VVNITAVARHATYTIDKQWLWNHATKFTRWQHPPVGHQARFAVYVMCMCYYYTVFTIGSFHFFDWSFHSAELLLILAGLEE